MPDETMAHYLHFVGLSEIDQGIGLFKMEVSLFWLNGIWFHAILRCDHIKVSRDEFHFGQRVAGRDHSSQSRADEETVLKIFLE